ncbi:MAG: ABC transporter substrate-binding protein [Xanthobacteraceae bacterium]
MMKYGIVLTLAVALASAPAEAATKVRVMYTAVAPYASVFIAKDQGFFEKRGLDVELILAANGSVIIAGVVSGNVEVGTPTPTVFLQAVDSGLDQVAIAATNAMPDASKSGVLARTDSGIKTAKDLVGKKVGVPGLNGLLDVIFRRWLASQGVDTKRVSYVETSFPQMSDLLRAGQVDAVVAVDPFYSRIVGQNTGYLVDDYTRNLPAGTIASVYSTTVKWANANPDAVKAFQEALVEAVAFSKTNDAATRESIARYTKLPPPVVANLPVPNLVAKISAQDFKFWIDVMKDRGMLTDSVDASKAVFPWHGGD